MSIVPIDGVLRPARSLSQHSLSKQAVRRRWRRRAHELFVRGRTSEALDLQRALLSLVRGRAPREELRDRYRLLRWQLLLGCWAEALEETEAIYARLARRGAGSSVAVGWLYLARAVAQFQLGLGSRFRRTLAAALREARRHNAPSLASTAAAAAAAYERLRSGESSSRARRWEERILSECDRFDVWPAPLSSAAQEWEGLFQLLQSASGLQLEVRDAGFSWARLPEFLSGPPVVRVLHRVLAAEAAQLDWGGDPSSGLAAALFARRWSEWVETDPTLHLPVWLPGLLSNLVRVHGAELAGDDQERLHRALFALAGRQREPAARAEALEAGAELALWVDEGSASSQGVRERLIRSRLVQARADLGLAAGLYRRLGLESRAEQAEARWARLAWPGASWPRVGATSARPEPSGASRAHGLAWVRARCREGGFITVDPRTLSELSSALLLAPSPLAVLILGESGTGKEVVAKAIHRWSGLRGEFVPIHCGAIPRDLLESELFGHARGAFTGASADKEGLVEVAAGGTLFLDEIGEMGADAQMKMLRVLESGEVRRVGELRPRTARVRLVAATHRDLDQAVDHGSFRLDLLHRIRGVVVRLRPLRERRADIAELAASFLANEAGGRSTLRLGEAGMARLLTYHWPGNVRELRSTLLRAAHLARALDRAVLDPDLLGLGPEDPGNPPMLVLARASETPDPAVNSEWADTESTLGLERTLESLERRLILRALEATRWNRTRAALSLGGLSRTTLLSKMKRLGIENPGIDAPTRDEGGHIE